MQLLEGLSGFWLGRVLKIHERSHCYKNKGGDMVFSDVVELEERLTSNGFSGVYSPWKWEGGESRYFSLSVDEEKSDMFYVTHGITIREQKGIERVDEVKRNERSYYFNKGKEKVSSDDIFNCVSIKRINSKEVFIETDTISDILKRS